MLVAEVNLEVLDLLAEAHEAKRAGLDDARVDRADGDLVNLLAVDPVERKRVHRGQVPMFEANRLQPRMPADTDAVLLVKLALECVEGEKLGRQAVVAPLGGDDRAKYVQRPCLRLENRRDENLAARSRAV